jgi:TPR repeat protein
MNGFFCIVLSVAIIAQVAGPTEQSSPTERPRTTQWNQAEISQLQAKAEAGELAAQASLAKAYEEGDGVQQNDELAFKWYRKAAEHGDPDAQNRVGLMYNLGRGTQRNKEQAVGWFHKAARQKNAKAMFNLGAAYYNGEGVGVDDNTSLAWFLLSQEHGNPAADDAVRRAISARTTEQINAFVTIAQMYTSGVDLPKDSTEVLKWYRKAGDMGNPRAGVMAASLLLAPGRNSSQEEYVEALHRCESAANGNYGPGAYCMAFMSKQGIAGEKNPIETAKWLTRAAELGHPEAMFDLGEAYRSGQGVKQDAVVAYMWNWLAITYQYDAAKPAEEELRKQITAKQVEQAKRKAGDWIAKHRPAGLQQRRPDSSISN